MTRLPHFRWALLVVATLASATLAEERLGSTQREGILLLNNGEALAGRVALIGDQYYVTQNGAEFRVKTGDAQFFCRDLDEAYERQSQAIAAGKVTGHIALAEWCLRQQLHGYAALELEEILSLEPRHPKLPLLERRLRLAVSGPAKPPENQPASLAPSNADLDGMVRSLPPGAVETFTTTVQPLLLNHCATAGCHGPTAEDELRLGKAPPGYPLTRRLTQRNLASAIKLLDREQPDQSPLLLMARQAHGTAKSAPLGDRDIGPLRQLDYWIRRVASRPAQAAAANVPSPAPLLQVRESIQLPGQPSPDEPDASDPLAPAGQEYETAEDEPVDEDDEANAQPTAETSEEASASSSTDDGPTKSARRRKPPQRGRAITTFTPIDPFDPEIFNRQYGPKEKDEGETIGNEETDSGAKN
ncbi:MAG: hypothetical protein AB7O62_08655 [Pirellulales bacterium]